MYNASQYWQNLFLWVTVGILDLSHIVHLHTCACMYSVHMCTCIMLACWGADFHCCLWNNSCPSGHVVDGYSSEVSQFTTQNLVKSFNHRWLRHVELVEPPPAFPVGSKQNSSYNDNTVHRLLTVFWLIEMIVLYQESTVECAPL